MDDLGVGIVLLQLAEKLVGDPLRCLGHGLGEFESDPFSVGEEVAGAEVQQRKNSLVGSPFGASPASIAVHSKGAADHGGHLHVQQKP